MDHRLIVGGELVLYGPVGIFDAFDNTGFTAGDVASALAQMEGDIVARINSGGGIASEGAAIFNALKRRDGAVNVVIDGIAASAASLIAMAGGSIEMPSGAIMMIHEPSGVTFGPSDAHRKTAEVLDTLTGVYAQVYADRTGLPQSEIRAMMKAETWLDPASAVEKGFATKTSDAGAAAADASFDYGSYRNAPADLVELAKNRQAESLPMVALATAAPKPEGRTKNMPKPNPSADPTQAAINPAPAAIDPAPVNPTAPADPAPAPVADNSGKIFELCHASNIVFDDAVTIVAEAGNSLDKAKDLIISRLSAADPDHGKPEPVATVIADARDKFKTGVTKALLARAGMDGGERNEFAGYTMREIARESLMMAGIKATNMADPMTMIGAAFGMPNYIMAGQQSTSDFTEILSNIAGKSMLKGWNEAAETFSQWTSRGTLTDFKSTKRVDLNLFPALAEVPEGGEYSMASISDRGTSVVLATYGKKFSITRQAIINDDLPAFSKVPMKMGRAARRTVGNLVYAVLTANAALGDGIALFHANHSNLASSGGAPSVTTFSAGRTAMGLQKDPDSIAKGGLNIRPSFILVPLQLEDTANVLMNSEFDPAKTQRTPNPSRNGAMVIAEARLSDDSSTAWYLAADPNQYDTVEVSYLNGQESPTLEQRPGWDVDGVEFKVRQDATADPLDFRGLYKNPG